MGRTIRHERHAANQHDSMTTPDDQKNDNPPVSVQRTGSESPSRGTDYCLHGFSFGSSAKRQAAAVCHPLWEAYITWDRRRNYGTPDMDDAHDREVFEAYIEGAYQAALRHNDQAQRPGHE